MEYIIPKWLYFAFWVACKAARDGDISWPIYRQQRVDVDKQLA